MSLFTSKVSVLLLATATAVYNGEHACVSTSTCIEGVASLKLKPPRATVEPVLQFNDDGIPEQYVCPFSQALMEDPVMAADNKIYDRQSITKWFEQQKKTREGQLSKGDITEEQYRSAIDNWKSSFSNDIMQSMKLTPKPKVKKQIDRFKEELQLQSLLPTTHRSPRQSFLSRVTRPLSATSSSRARQESLEARLLSSSRAESEDSDSPSSSVQMRYLPAELNRGSLQETSPAADDEIGTSSSYLEHQILVAKFHLERLPISQQIKAKVIDHLTATLIKDANGSRDSKHISHDVLLEKIEKAMLLAMVEGEEPLVTAAGGASSTDEISMRARATEPGTNNNDEIKLQRMLFDMYPSITRREVKELRAEHTSTTGVLDFNGALNSYIDSRNSITATA